MSLFVGFASTGDLSANLKGEMSVVRANIQTVEEIYQLIWTAIASKRPIEAVYKGLPRLLCPHRLGRNRGGELRVLCYQYGGESESGLEAPGSPANWRCTALEVQPGKVTGGRLVHGAQPFSPRILCDRR
jgi:hypothetical protein